MLFFHLFRHYFLSFKSASLIRVVAWFCLGGLTVSVAALVLVLSIMDGFGQSIKNRLLNNEAHLIISSKKKGSSIFQKTENLYALLPEPLKKNIKTSVLFETQDTLLKTPNGFSGVIAKGYETKTIERMFLQVGKERFENLHHTKDLSTLPSKKEILSEDTIKAPSHNFSLKSQDKKNPPASSLPLIINQSLSETLSLYEGDSVLLTPILALLLPPSELPPLKKAHIQGVIAGSPQNQGEENFFVFYEKGGMDFKDFSAIHSAWEIRLKDPENYKSYLPYFKDYKVEHWAERNSSLLFALKMEKFIMLLFIALSILISCLGISVALLLLIIQKRKDIGILQAMGLSQKAIAKIFTGIGLSLSSIGVTGGMTLGILLTAFFKYNKWNILPAMYYDRSLPANFLPFHYMLILLGSLCVAFLACYLPSLHLSRIPPSELLKETGR